MSIAFDHIVAAGSVWRVHLTRRKAQDGDVTVRPWRQGLGFDLIVPRGLDDAGIEALYRLRRPWLALHADWRAGTRGDLPIASLATLPLWGEPHRVHHDDAAPRKVTRTAGTITIGGPSEHAGARLGRWLYAQARRGVEARLAQLVPMIGKAPARIAVRDTRSRWGSCSARGTLSFSWRPILAPPFVMDYLAAHEAAHLVHMNHGADFWALVARLCPQWRLGHDYLKLAGPYLMRFRL